jgi:restriction system protein
MTIPRAPDLRIPLLKLLSDQNEHPIEEAKDSLAKTFQVTESERKKIYSGRQRHVFDSRVIQAVSYLRKAGLIENRERGVFKITKAGLNKLKQDANE